MASQQNPEYQVSTLNNNKLSNKIILVTKFCQEIEMIT